MSITLNFDATTVEPTVAFEALPAATYPVALIAAKVEQAKDGQSHYVSCDFVVQDGKHKGRHVYDNLNLYHATSQQAKEIAWRQLSGLCHAAGVLQVQTIDQLFGIVVAAKVGVEESAKYGASNIIKAFSKYEGGSGIPDFNTPGDPNPAWAQQPAETPAAAPQSTPAPETAAASPPWQQAPGASASEAPASPPWAK